MSKLKSVKYPHQYAGQKLTFPIIGEATFNEDGTLDVADEHEEAFINATVDSFIFEPVEADDENDGDGDLEEESDDKNVKGKSEAKSKAQSAKEYQETKAELDSLNFEQLVELGKAAGIPDEDLANMTDKKLRKILLNKSVKK